MDMLARMESQEYLQQTISMFQKLYLQYQKGCTEDVRYIFEERRQKWNWDVSKGSRFELCYCVLGNDAEEFRITLDVTKGSLSIEAFSLSDEDAGCPALDLLKWAQKNVDGCSADFDVYVNRFMDWSKRFHERMDKKRVIWRLEGRTVWR